MLLCCGKVQGLSPERLLLKPKTSPACLQDSVTEVQQEREVEALNSRKFACSHCGEVGHNKRRCPELAHEREKEEEQKRRKQRGPLWGLAGVEEQRMPGGRKRVLVFPVPVQVQDTVSQVHHDSPSCRV